MTADEKRAEAIRVLFFQMPASERRVDVFRGLVPNLTGEAFLTQYVLLDRARHQRSAEIIEQTIELDNAAALADQADRLMRMLDGRAGLAEVSV